MLPRISARSFNCAEILTVAALIGALANGAHAETWADRLGFPPGSKVVLLHVNELGLAYETNAAATKLLETGPARSASAIVPAPWFLDLVKWAKAHPNIDLGLELTLNSELPNYRWEGVAHDDLTMTLDDADGFLWASPVQTMVNASAEDVEHEVRAQIRRAKEAGLRPSHLTTHLGTLVTRPDLIEVYLRVAREEWIPAVVVELTAEQVARFEANGFPMPDNIIQLLADYPLPKVDDLHMVADADSYAAKKAEFLKMLAGLQPGITQIAFRPAAESDALKQITPRWQQRVWDAQLLADPEVQQALAADGVMVTDWRELMRRFEGRPPEADQQSE
jgi:predicted glycoside hydrolase/deacetylase ChbG (UPF0249 family)